ncbi:hypothetical protein D9757_011731 [Collybiopsis confluens]|uniref:Uncharacterized protein n=1 Tax=Collybiopsis confluens TaxID=2823264 RepID=A0A8H5LK54_9AGAR|nr:hypothetical protein D9757_011731 [Collybiopsis confluens]
MRSGLQYTGLSGSRIESIQSSHEDVDRYADEVVRLKGQLSFVKSLLKGSKKKDNSSHITSFSNSPFTLQSKNLEEGGDLAIFESASKLRILAAQKLVSLDPVVLGRITDLSYAVADVADANIHTVLNFCTRLQKLTITSDSWAVYSSVTLVPSLTSLHIRAWDTYCNVISIINAPSLTTLELEHHVPPSSSLFACAVEDFLKRSTCFLTKLSTKLSWTDEEVIALLRNLPTLRDLVICEPLWSGLYRPITRAFSKAFRSLPGLRRVRLSFRNFNPFPWKCRLRKRCLLAGRLSRWYCRDGTVEMDSGYGGCK